MLENQFLQFSETLDNGCGLALPKRKDTRLEFYATDNDGIKLRGRANIVDINGARLSSIYGTIGDGGYCALPMPMIADLNNDQCFRVVLNNGVDTSLRTSTSRTFAGGETNHSEFIGGWFVRGYKRTINLNIDPLKKPLQGFSIDTMIIMRSSFARGECNFYLVINGVTRTQKVQSYTGGDVVFSLEGLPMGQSQKTVDIFYSITNSANTTSTIVDVTAQISINSYSYYLDPLYSNLLKIDNDGSSWIRYKCDEDAMGFPFASAGGWCALDLPIIVHNPQPTQDDKVYTTLSGRNITLYSEVGKEYECETEYIPEEWHDKLAIALACDEVYINGKLLSKSDKYQIAWDEKDTMPCGTELARATFKMKENIVQRNSNY